MISRLGSTPLDPAWLVQLSFFLSFFLFLLEDHNKETRSDSRLITVERYLIIYGQVIKTLSRNDGASNLSLLVRRNLFGAEQPRQMEGRKEEVKESHLGFVCDYKAEAYPV